MDEGSSTSDVDLRVEHREALRYHAIELLNLAHRTVNASSLSGAEEEDITGVLKDAIEEIIEKSDDAPAWVSHYTVFDEEKPSGSGKLGKRRPRIDITIKRHWAIRESHPRFRFEAKRLKSDNRLSAYFGRDGIGCFLRGRYPLTHGEAGMIGYVQAGKLVEWENRLGNYAKKNSMRLRIVEDGSWQSFECCLPFSSSSRHRHPTLNEVTIVHLLLPFC